jgi:hypothetical protein
MTVYGGDDVELRRGDRVYCDSRPGVHEIAEVSPFGAGVQFVDDQRWYRARTVYQA